MGKVSVMAKTVSVGMAVYNGEKYLPAQIDSILKQLKDDDELVISYDQSIDDTKALIDAYAENDSRVRVIENDRPGIVGNFNNALKHCRKDIIFISDQDDEWAPGKRDKMVAALESSHADLAIHNAVHVDANGNPISKSLFEMYNIHSGIWRNFTRPRYSGCCMAFTTKAKKLILPMPESVINYDHWVGMVCELFGSVVFVDDVLLRHRLHGGNVTTSRRTIRIVAQQRFNLLRELMKRKRQLQK